MKIYFYFSCLWLYSQIVLSEDRNVSRNFINLEYSRDGNISLIVITAKNCENEDLRELQERASAIWTTEALNEYNYLSGITLGLKIISACNGEHTLKKYISKVIEKDIEKGILNVGILTPPKLYSEVLAINQEYNVPVTEIRHIVDKNILIQITVDLLSNLEWMIVDKIVSDDKIIINSFNEKTSDERICVRDELLINNSLELKGLSNGEDFQVIVIIAAFSNMSAVLEKIQNQTKLILVPTDFIFNQTTVFENFIADLPKDTILLLPPTESKNILSNYKKTTKHHKDFFNQRRPIKSPLFLGVAGSVLEALKPYKKLQDELCKDINLNSKQPCAKVVDFIDSLKENKTFLQLEKSMKISPDEMANVLQVLKIDPSSNDEMFLYIALLINSNSSEDFAIFQIFSAKTKKVDPILLMINDNLFSDREMKNKSGIKVENSEQTFENGLEWDEEIHKQKQDSLIKLLQSLTSRSIGNLKKANKLRKYEPENVTLAENISSEPCDIQSDPKQVYRVCQNFGKTEFQENVTMENHPVVVWCFLTWVSVNTSVGFIGVICTLCIMFFVVSRICKDDILEGSPYFSLLLMISVILMFISSIPFHLTLPGRNDLLCIFRETGPPLVYGITFSLMLSRSLMLASTEGDRFVSHVNGYLQTILFCFVIGIQISLTSQYILYNDFGKGDCVEINNKYKTMISLIYEFILLVLLACVSPFIIRSKRNYKEGLLFSIALFFIFAVWSVWISFYFLLPNEYNNATIAVGLNSTGCVLLICIFIPRTYLMAAAIVRDKTARSLPTLDRNILTEVIDNNFKSNQSLNDSVFGTITYKTSELGLSNPNFCSGRRIDGARQNSNTSLNREINTDLPSNASLAK